MEITPARSGEKIIIAALGENGVIGRDGGLPWDVPEDRRLFRALTLGHALIMGRRTFASLGRPLDGRLNLVISRTLAPRPDLVVCPDFPAALARAEASGRAIFFIGGAAVYRQALPLAERMILSRIPGSFAGDTFFPSFCPAAWRLVDEQQRGAFILQVYRAVATQQHHG
ncbi:dihydrofolate reductase [Geoalkalibacter halelectricus]|uniref:Dihydrofolate reductase n=1 Tax=Geoalkalibacter halelectricus TaxID=2847045 RepID=A0ABY5ZJJ8_9BACT|nr:dihydrofolate reductase [Geoalkalibacter halelectricus]MDO3377905.1 dihydrofolate reductase [Geoalkalibacter halelectricus]UWZ77914.1 dihydrofolate reductase [Geoalkalibacter halelectricus]